MTDRPKITTLHPSLIPENVSDPDYKAFCRSQLDRFYVPHSGDTIRDIIMAARRKGGGLWGGHILIHGRRAALMNRILLESMYSPNIKISPRTDEPSATNHVMNIYKPADPMTNWYSW